MRAFGDIGVYYAPRDVQRKDSAAHRREVRLSLSSRAEKEFFLRVCVCVCSFFVLFSLRPRASLYGQAGLKARERSDTRRARRLKLGSQPRENQRIVLQRSSSQGFSRSRAAL